MERTHEFNLSVPADPLSLVIVRRAVQGLAEICGEEVANRLAVIYNELVTNAIRHAGLRQDAHIEVLLQIGADGVIRGSVCDDGRGFDPTKVPVRQPEQEGGFGLRIIGRMASDWGVHTDGRTEVWFEL